MNEAEIWKKISTGKFWYSGGIVYDQNKNIAGQTTTTPIEIMKSVGKAVPGDSDNAVYGGCTWDTTFLFENNKSIYKPDGDHKPTMFKPDLAQCIDAFLDAETKEFIMNSLEKAYSTMRKYCTGDFVVSAMIATKPVMSLPMHIHAVQRQLSFTYFVSSNVNKPNTSVVVLNKDNQINEMPYPDSKDFFAVLDTSLWHGVKTLEGDNNHYIYFVFDEVELLDNNSIEIQKFYTV